MNDSVSPKRKRCWYQFSLRTWLVVIVLLAVGIGWTGNRMYRARENRARMVAFDNEVSALEALGWRVRTKLTRRRFPNWLEKWFDDPGGPEVYVREVTEVTFSQHYGNESDLNAPAVDRLAGLENLESVTVCLRGGYITDIGLGHLTGLTQVRHLILQDCRYITDAGLRRLKVLTNLQSLFLDCKKVTGAGLENLRGLTNLQDLTLADRCRFGDDGLEHLKGLSNLKTLKILSPNVTDAGLEHLKELTNLEVLELRHLQITDDGLEYLKGLTKLRRLDLRITPVTDEGVKTLQQALPNCEIQH